MKILVTGGAGYIGSHTVHQLIENNHEVVVVDNLYSGKKQNLHPQAKFYLGDFSSEKILDQIFSENTIEVVMHFAAYTDVAESVEDPKKYIENNYENSKKLIYYSQHENIKSFVFSSTAAVYGVPSSNPVSETAATNPISPYGKSKLDVEVFLEIQQTNDFNAVILRYFNVAGARIDGKLNSSLHNDHKHLFKTICETLTGKREFVPIFGGDYETEDGTGIRDYIHVDDLASAHISALTYLQESKKSDVFNCGYGNGFSVLQVIKTMEKVANQKIPYKIMARRVGDSPATYSDSTKLKSKTSWVPQYNDLEVICKSALAAFL